jgi:molybdopterin synthase sulfur carrier subunit
MITVVYFAWLRERIGTGREEIETQAKTVAQLVAELSAQDSYHAAAFADLRAVRVAVDQVLCDFDTPIAAAKEVAFFPPMTGG